MQGEEGKEEEREWEGRRQREDRGKRHRENFPSLDKAKAKSCSYEVFDGEKE